MTSQLYSYPRNPVYTRSLDPSVLVCSLSLYRHPSICILFISHFTSYNKHKKSLLVSLRPRSWRPQQVDGKWCVVQHVSLRQGRVSRKKDQGRSKKRRCWTRVKEVRERYEFTMKDHVDKSMGNRSLKIHTGSVIERGLYSTSDTTTRCHGKTKSRCHYDQRQFHCSQQFSFNSVSFIVSYGRCNPLNSIF